MMSRMTDEETKAFLIDVHRAIEDQVADIAHKLVRGVVEDVTYPPNGGFTADEFRALQALHECRTPALESAFRKLMADAAAGVVFELFCLIDGVGDPQNFAGDWETYQITAARDDRHEMLHDEFYATYWDWRDLRSKPWRLDIVED